MWFPVSDPDLVFLGAGEANERKMKKKQHHISTILSILRWQKIRPWVVGGGGGCNCPFCHPFDPQLLTYLTVGTGNLMVSVSQVIHWIILPGHHPIRTTNSRTILKEL